MTKRTKLAALGAIIVGVAAVAGVTAMKRSPKATEVRIEAVEARDLVASVTASGQVRPHTKVDVVADIPSPGRVVRLAVEEGQVVSKGQFLLQIDPEQYQAAVQRAEASVASARAQAAQARANLLQARRNYERSAAIKRTNAQLVSDEQLEQLRTAVEVNEALASSASYSAAQASAGLKDARTSLSRTTIVAPMAGRITRLNVEVGETAVPGNFNRDQATLLTISDMSRLETRVKVDETDVSRIAIGDSAEVQLDAFPDTTFVGRVIEISNSSLTSAAAGQASDQAVDYEVTVELVNPPSETRPDFSATAKIITDSRARVLSIPIIALTVREDSAIANGDTAVTVGGRPAPAKQVGRRDVEGVFVVGRDNKVLFRPVRVGIAGERYFEVVSGLKAGDRIVAGNYQAIRELKDSSLVRETPTDAPGGAAAKGGAKS